MIVSEESNIDPRADQAIDCLNHALGCKHLELEILLIDTQDFVTQHHVAPLDQIRSEMLLNMVNASTSMHLMLLP